MGDRYGSSWLTALPWILLGRRTAYQADLDTSPAELVLRQTPRVPGDLVENEGQTLPELLQNLRTNAAKQPIPTSHNSKITPYFPEAARVATRVMMKRGKPTQLGDIYEGPFPIIQRIGESCLKIRTGNWANGNPRHELTHWNSCYPVPLTAELADAHKAIRGRKKILDPDAPSFVPAIA